jgi:hypothetical protein
MSDTPTAPTTEAGRRLMKRWNPSTQQMEGVSVDQADKDAGEWPADPVQTWKAAEWEASAHRSENHDDSCECHIGICMECGCTNEVPRPQPALDVLERAVEAVWRAAKYKEPYTGAAPAGTVGARSRRMAPLNVHDCEDCFDMAAEVVLGASQERPQPDLRAALKAYDKQQITGPELADVVRASQEWPQPDSESCETATALASGHHRCQCLCHDTQERPSIDVERLAHALHNGHDDYRCGGWKWHEVEARDLAAEYLRLSGPVGE